MAASRMFDIRLMQSDAFTRMSQGAQLLYVQLALSADDDGFTESIRLSKFLSGSSDSELQELEENKFIILFDDGKVLVIRHWKRHNHIRSDRYKPTKYQEFFSQITDVEGVYQLKKSGIPADNQLSTDGIPAVNLDQIRLDKNRSDQNRSGQGRKEENRGAGEKEEKKPILSKLRNTLLKHDRNTVEHICEIKSYPVDEQIEILKQDLAKMGVTV